MKLRDRTAILVVIDRLLGEVRAQLTRLSPGDIPAVAGELLDIVRELYRDAPPGTPRLAVAATTPGPDRVSVAREMQLFFAARGNEPATIAEICAGGTLNEQTVKSILYKRNRGRFVQVAPTSGSGQPSRWRMTPLREVGPGSSPGGE